MTVDELIEKLGEFNGGLEVMTIVIERTGADHKEVFEPITSIVYRMDEHAVVLE